MRTTKKQTLADLGDAVTEAGIRTAPKLPDLRNFNAPKLVTGEQAEAVQEAAKDQLQKLPEIIREVAAGMNPAVYGENAEAVINFEEKLVQFVEDDGWTVTTKSALAKALVSEMVSQYPDTSQSLNHIADVAVSVGLLTETRSRDEGIHLPVSTGERGNSRWRGKFLGLTQAFRAELGLMKALRQKAKRVDQERIAAKRAAREELHEGHLVDFEKALESGGKTVAYAPDKKRSGRFYGGGEIRLSVENGKVHFVSAVGKCANFVERLTKAGIEIPAEAVREHRYEIPGRLDQTTFDLTIGAHGLLHRAWKKARQHEERVERKEEMKESTTADPFDFVLRGEVGTAYLTLRSWEDRSQKPTRQYRGLYFVAERNEDGEIRVSDCPRFAESLFASCREFTAPGEKFSGLPAPLGDMLRVLYSIFSKVEARKAREAEQLAQACKEAGVEPEAETETDEDAEQDEAAEAA